MKCDVHESENLKKKKMIENPSEVDITEILLNVA
jgi:hypothetical protein